MISPAEKYVGSTSGITNWQGKTYSNDLTKSLRVWPHKSGTGGFFAAILEKVSRTSDHPPAQITDQEDKAQTVIDGFIEHFDLPPKTFEGLRTIRTGRRLKLISADHRIPEIPQIQASGLTLTNDSAKVPKLSTEAAMTFGKMATRNIVELNPTERAAFMAQQPVSFSEDRATLCSDKGYVLVCSEGITLGIGMLRRDQKTALLESQFPKNWA